MARIDLDDVYISRAAQDAWLHVCERLCGLISRGCAVGTEYAVLDEHGGMELCVETSIGEFRMEIPEEHWQWAPGVAS